jgi:hypothetical protein
VTGQVTANATEITSVNDVTMSGWSAELSFADGWDFVQFASVNDRSHLKIESDDDPEKMEQFTGWRVTLDKDGLRALIDAAHDLYDRLPD